MGDIQDTDLVKAMDHINLSAENAPVSSGFAPTWLCAICLEKIKMTETSQIKGCEHAYCVTCILRWASYKSEPWCPQCKLPFSSLYVCKTLDGRMSDYMVEESVCLLLRASWFNPLTIEVHEEQDDYYPYEEDMYEEYGYTSNVRLGNRRWGDSGYVRGGRREARPVGVRTSSSAGASAESSSSSSASKAKEPTAAPAAAADGVVAAASKGKESTAGRRAKRAQKREDLRLKAQHSPAA